eukprot:scaffold3685_cov242-Pinguiococcus_pyrenoidosus.AAC.15
MRTRLGFTSTSSTRARPGRGSATPASELNCAEAGVSSATCCTACLAQFPGTWMAGSPASWGTKVPPTKSPNASLLKNSIGAGVGHSCASAHLVSLRPPRWPRNHVSSSMSHSSCSPTRSSSSASGSSCCGCSARRMAALSTNALRERGLHVRKRSATAACSRVCASATWEKWQSTSIAPLSSKARRFRNAPERRRKSGVRASLCSGAASPDEALRASLNATSATCLNTSPTPLFTSLAEWMWPKARLAHARPAQRRAAASPESSKLRRRSRPAS